MTPWRSMGVASVAETVTRKAHASMLQYLHALSGDTALGCTPRLYPPSNPSGELAAINWMQTHYNFQMRLPKTSKTQIF